MIFGHKISTQSDAELIECYRKDGRPDQVGELFARYSHLVFGLCLKYLRNRDDAHDAVLAIFEKLMSDLKKHEVDQFSHWLCTVSRNHCLMFLRTRNHSDQRLDAYRTTLNGHAHEEIEEVTSAEIRERGLQQLEQAISRLNDLQNKCVRLFYLEEKSYKQISEETGFAVNEVKSHIQNGRRNLKILLGNK